MATAMSQLFRPLARYTSISIAYQAAGAIFGDPMHPYTLGLLGSVPRLDEERETLLAIDGSVPPPFALPKGCRFHPRCPFSAPECRSDQPPLPSPATSSL